VDRGSRQDLASGPVLRSTGVRGRRRAMERDEVSASASALTGVARLAALLGLLYGFFIGLDLMGLAFKLFGRGFAETLIEQTANPMVGLLVGILATSLVQSSSTTTAMTVGLVAAGALTVDGAIPIVIGAGATPSGSPRGRGSCCRMRPTTRWSSSVNPCGPATAHRMSHCRSAAGRCWSTSTAKAD